MNAEPNGTVAFSTVQWVGACARTQDGSELGQSGDAKDSTSVQYGWKSKGEKNETSIPSGMNDVPLAASLRLFVFLLPQKRPPRPLVRGAVVDGFAFATEKVPVARACPEAGC